MATTGRREVDEDSNGDDEYGFMANVPCAPPEESAEEPEKRPSLIGAYTIGDGTITANVPRGRRSVQFLDEVGMPPVAKSPINSNDHANTTRPPEDDEVGIEVVREQQIVMDQDSITLDDLEQACMAGGENAATEQAVELPQAEEDGNFKGENDVSETPSVTLDDLELACMGGDENVAVEQPVEPVVEEDKHLTAGLDVDQKNKESESLDECGQIEIPRGHEQQALKGEDFNAPLSFEAPSVSLEDSEKACMSDNEKMNVEIAERAFVEDDGIKSGINEFEGIEGMVSSYAEIEDSFAEKDVVSNESDNREQQTLEQSLMNVGHCDSQHLSLEEPLALDTEVDDIDVMEAPLSTSGARSTLEMDLSEDGIALDTEKEMLPTPTFTDDLGNENIPTPISIDDLDNETTPELNNGDVISEEAKIMQEVQDIEVNVLMPCESVTLPQLRTFETSNKLLDDKLRALADENDSNCFKGEEDKQPVLPEAYLNEPAPIEVVTPHHGDADDQPEQIQEDQAENFQASFSDAPRMETQAVDEEDILSWGRQQEVEILEERVQAQALEIEELHEGLDLIQMQSKQLILQGLDFNEQLAEQTAHCQDLQSQVHTLNAQLRQREVEIKRSKQDTRDVSEVEQMCAKRLQHREAMCEQALQYSAYCERAYSELESSLPSKFGQLEAHARERETRCESFLEAAAVAGKKLSASCMSEIADLRDELMMQRHEYAEKTQAHEDALIAHEDALQRIVGLQESHEIAEHEHGELQAMHDSALQHRANLNEVHRTALQENESLQQQLSNSGDLVAALRSELRQAEVAESKAALRGKQVEEIHAACPSHDLVAHLQAELASSWSQISAQRLSSEHRFALLEARLALREAQLGLRAEQNIEQISLDSYRSHLTDRQRSPMRTPGASLCGGSPRLGSPFLTGIRAAQLGANSPYTFERGQTFPDMYSSECRPMFQGPFGQLGEVSRYGSPVSPNGESIRPH